MTPARSRLQTSRCTFVMPTPDFEPRCTLLTLALLASIYWMSSLPDVSGTEPDPLIQLVSNLAHAPLFAGLAFCLLKTLSGGRQARRSPGGVYRAVFLGAGTYAALDEWHQSFVPGRYPSVADFLLDLTGIIGMLLILRLRALRETNP